MRIGVMRRVLLVRAEVLALDGDSWRCGYLTGKAISAHLTMSALAPYAKREKKARPKSETEFCEALPLCLRKTKVDFLEYSLKGARFPQVSFAVELCKDLRVRIQKNQLFLENL